MDCWYIQRGRSRADDLDEGVVMAVAQVVGTAPVLSRGGKIFRAFGFRDRCGRCPAGWRRRRGTGLAATSGRGAGVQSSQVLT